MVRYQRLGRSESRMEQARHHVVCGLEVVSNLEQARHAVVCGFEAESDLVGAVALYLFPDHYIQQI